MFPVLEALSMPKGPLGDYGQRLQKELLDAWSQGGPAGAGPAQDFDVILQDQDFAHRYAFFLEGMHRRHQRGEPDDGRSLPRWDAIVAHRPPAEREAFWFEIFRRSSPTDLPGFTKSDVAAAYMKATGEEPTRSWIDGAAKVVSRSQIAVHIDEGSLR